MAVAAAHMSEVLAEAHTLVVGLGTTIFLPQASREALSKGPPVFGRDVKVVCLFAFVMFAYNWVVRLAMVKPLLSNYFQLHRQKLDSCAQSVMEASFHFAFTVMGVFVVPMQVWVWPSALWWIGFNDGGHEIMRVDMRCYYLAYMARYLQLFFSVLLESKNKDFIAMVIHHLATVAVISVSYSAGWNRVGVVVMLLMDPADLPLHCAKVCKHIGESGASVSKWWQFFTDRLFELFAFVFFMTRIVVYSYVCWSVFFEATAIIPNYGGVPGMVCISLVFVLLILQIYWFYLILRIAIKHMVKGEPIQDTRSDEEETNGVHKEAAVSNSEQGQVRPYMATALKASCAAVTGYECSRLCRADDQVVPMLGSLLRDMSTAVMTPSAGSSLPSTAADPIVDKEIAVVLAIGIFILNWIIRLGVVEPVLKSFIGARPQAVPKFSQSVMEAILYGFFSVVGVRLVFSQEWLWPSSEWWTGLHKNNLVVRNDLKCYYLVYIARYIQGCVSVLFEPKRKDFVQMMLHHIVTVVVCCMSYAYGMRRVGVVVMVLFDPADVPLHLAKICKYTGEAVGNSAYQFLADRLFEVFGVVFFVTRLVIFSYVCWSCQFEARQHLLWQIPGEWLAYCVCMTSLYILLGLQVYWQSLILSVALKLLRGQSVEDVRSDDDEPSTKKVR